MPASMLGFLVVISTIKVALADILLVKEIKYNRNLIGIRQAVL